MSGFLIRLLLPALALALSASAPRAADVASRELGDPVPGAINVTYLDLARQVLPDLGPRGSSYGGSKVIAMRHIGGADLGAAPPEQFNVYRVAAVTLRADGRDRLALMIDLGETADAVENFVLLALFEAGGPPILLDAAQVGFDRSTYFRDPAAVALNADSDLLLTMSGHFNPHQSYLTSAMILVRDGRLRLVDTVFTFDDRLCAYERTQVPDFSTGPALGRDRGYADIAVVVTETVAHTGGDCGEQALPPPGTRTIRAIYGWDDAQGVFVPDTDALDVLARDNEARF